jgi:hypothetical protein
MATLKNTTINDTGFLLPASGTTAQRPVSPTAGMLRYNTNISNMEYYNGTEWINLNTTVPVLPTLNRIVDLDASNVSSYSGSGSTWFDLSGSGNHFTINSSAYVSSGVKYMDFNGAYGCAKKQNSDVPNTGDMTCICWTRVKQSTAEWRTLLRALSVGADHQVIILSGGFELGMYDNNNLTGFNGSGFSQQSLPGWNTGVWNMLIWRWYNDTSPHYRFGYNDSPGIVRSTISSPNAKFKSGVCSIGAYNDGNQNNPNLASQYWGDIARITLYNRVLSDYECLQYYNSTRDRFGF